MAGSTVCHRELNSFVLDIEDAIETIERAIAELAAAASENFVEGVLFCSELLLRDVLMIEDLLPEQEGLIVVNSIACLVSAVRAFKDEFTRSHMRGRPQIPIHEEQLTSLLDLHFSNQEIAHLLNVSPHTIRWRIIQFGLQDQVNFTAMDDICLDAITQHFVDSHPNSGERSLAGFLRSTGLRVQRYRIRESLMRVDPRGVQIRFRQVFHRRRYNVTMPNSLWHIDGYHSCEKYYDITNGASSFSI